MKKIYDNYPRNYPLLQSSYNVIQRKKKKKVKYTYTYLHNAYVCVPEDDIER